MIEVLIHIYTYVYRSYMKLYLHYYVTFYILLYMNANKENKFKELAEIRVNRALNDLKLIGNLGNKFRYTSTPEQRKKIINSIKTAAKEMESNLNNQADEKTKWKL